MRKALWLDQVGRMFETEVSCCEEKKLFGSMGLNNVTDLVLTVRSAGEILPNSPLLYFLPRLSLF